MPRAFLSRRRTGTPSEIPVLRTERICTVTIADPVLVAENR